MLVFGIPSIQGRPIEKSEKSPIGYLTISNYKKLLVSLGNDFIASQHALGSNYFDIDCSQLVISLYLPNYDLQNNKVSKELFVMWIKIISHYRYDFTNHSYKKKIKDETINMRIPDVPLLQYENNIYTLTRLIAGNRYISWNPKSENNNRLMYKYRSKSYNGHIVPVIINNTLQYLSYGIDKLMDELYNSSVLKMIFLVSDSSFQPYFNTTVTRYNYHVIDVIRHPTRTIEYSGTCLKDDMMYFMRIALHKTIFELADFRNTEILVKKYYKSFELNLDKYSIAKEISGITKVEHIHYGDFFYSYITSNDNKIKIVNKRDMYILIKNQNYYEDITIFISSGVYKEIFYKIFIRGKPCSVRCINKLINLLIAAILDKNTKAVLSMENKYLLII